MYRQNYVYNVEYRQNYFKNDLRYMHRLRIYEKAMAIALNYLKFNTFVVSTHNKRGEFSSINMNVYLCFIQLCPDGRN